MTSQTELVKSSFAAVEPYGTQVTEYFYDHLFEHHPEVRPLFAEHMGEQRDRLWQALRALVGKVEDTEAVTRMLDGLGTRHVGYGATPAHLPAVGASLLAALKHFAGPAWTPETEAAWVAVYGVITDVMGRAMARAGAPAPAGTGHG
ncbi:hypothetical protein IGW14_11385 [Streptomyces hygroscopicus subsp. hygroscopicus]|uniref:globin domain-containing protein n=1 Tax=Streptomyces hygroscopicus TaxID=1912 RepID=UPI0007C804C4|nr:globin domain-containing protein [Streptomyces hygroscopicus]MBW8088615.1 hypothetical protein [Streptomyces hygroscopicus subsp. hygroscopicus]